ncbi:F-type ATPase subunit delta [uncultured Clostridium sp.]|uniref:ATP synthase subunit delta n=1 Tax=Paeniclostridium hominis TaxID=2764329 RepID=A0ABR7K6R5_9FIRM|nr:MULTISPECIES: F0F1 ATP synthase subunit delta [Paeniclostridium]MDU1540343.1 F0F1 ATP synthase subunit delta [Paeniclostridium sordellii]SCJ42803.1 F-type ATPase subunit delta [uncultured Clostridium sp.]MBC6004794.1 F0F1 ATP synthase subunit delta [Paeniclostridium hominis]MBC8632252.1 F0F1 ATP synthase subunit delta [[Eubacterium] tenue]MDU2592213.1 F0F1 ATP synthase subunit delta [Paeniclostridium sordellii]
MINIIASRYAEALFQVGEESNSTEKLYNELKAVVDIINVNKEFSNILKSPIVSKEEKKTLITNIFGSTLDNEMLNFMKILADKDRLNLLANMEEAFKALLNDKNNILEGVAITAVPMNEGEVNELQAKLSAKYNKTVVLQNEVDKSILGGVLVRLGNEEIDGTVKNRLDKMKEQLSQVIS